MSKPATYADAGVDIDAANRATEKIREFARRTFNSRTLSDIGSFGGMFDGAFPHMRQPVLVASADGVGTKLKVAFETGVHNTIGRDLVNHCVNDILVQGARPLFFLDYFATGKLDPEVTASVVEGIATGCRENGCVLLGGETAEMPDFYAPGEYDIAGFIVGVVDRERIIDGRTITAGDVILGLPSAGLHTNGYSLARKLFFEVAAFSVDTYVDEVEGSAGSVLLRPHVSYLGALEGVLDNDKIKGLAHITGGGFLDNIPRILPAATNAEIKRGSWPVLPVFELLQRIGNMEDHEMFRTFNMGIGMIIVCDAADAPTIKSHIESTGESCYEIGRIVSGDGRVVLT
ncbi:MAG TPA: phosphoribosylformylglycinamidine cyclo-ligase [Pyrinomonadaceae bacterium]|nr:phosphoribosylformylglycinamidine cyclo-ligase [Pyrinomonadaceae bacterium]